MLSNPEQQDQLVLDFIRHGEPVGGVRYRGTINDPLSETGWQQMRHSTQRALEHGCQWDEMISSPMERCIRFAEELSGKLDLPLEVASDLRELCFGDLEGLTPKQAWQQYPDFLKALWQDPEANTPPNGEGFTEFVQRVKQSLDQIIQSHSNQHLLIVAHGGVIRAALTCLLNIAPKETFQVQVPYAGISRITVYKSADDIRCSLNFVNRYQGEPV